MQSDPPGFLFATHAKLLFVDVAQSRMRSAGPHAAVRKAARNDKVAVPTAFEAKIPVCRIRPAV
jgi:hypothetical protein